MPWDIWLIFFALGVILPWRGRMRMKKLLAVPHVSSTERLALYASTIAFQWVAVAVVAWRAWAHPFSASPLCFTISRRSPIFFPPTRGAQAHPALYGPDPRRFGRIPSTATRPLQAL